ncbi:MAG: hypothetical protein LBR47_05640 [Spirochaetaceae bacterium]|nr:hypothetical protein [Spirochaetaceae bacterium]
MDEVENTILYDKTVSPEDFAKYQLSNFIMLLRQPVFNIDMYNKGETPAMWVIQMTEILEKIMHPYIKDNEQATENVLAVRVSLFMHNIENFILRMFDEIGRMSV